MLKLFFTVDGVEIPLVSTGTSTFFGAAQFGKNARIYRKKFLNDTNAMLEILEASYKAGGRGIEAIPGGKICEAAKIMMETHDDFVVTGSTFPGPDPLIDDLIEIDAKLIFVHGMVSDSRDDKLIRLLEEVASRGVIPGIAAHNPFSTLNFAIKNSLNVNAFLIPFNANGLYMGEKQKLEDLVDSTKNYAFIGMKTMAAGKLDPEKAFDYISKHNINAVTVGMVTEEEAEVSTKLALNALQKF
jgi:hypothetical protein